MDDFEEDWEETLRKDEERRIRSKKAFEEYSEKEIPELTPEEKAEVEERDYKLAKNGSVPHQEVSERYIREKAEREEKKKRLSDIGKIELNDLLNKETLSRKMEQSDKDLAEALNRSEKEAVDPQVDLEEMIENNIASMSEEMGVDFKKEMPRVPVKNMHQDRLMCYMAAFGCSHAEIGAHFGFTEKETARILSKRQNVEEIRRTQEKVFLEKSGKVFQRILPKAVFTAEEIMENKANNPNVRLNAAIHFMDRSLGKPTQHIEEKGSIIRELFNKMDEMRQVKVAPVDRESIITDAEFHELKKEEEPKDPIDSFAEENFS